MNLSMIVAMTPERVIGRKGEIPWRIPSDLKRFRDITAGGTLIMGWNTFLSIINRNGEPLAGRKNIVLTHKHRKEVLAQNAIPVPSPEAALGMAPLSKIVGVYIIGGAKVYERFLPLTSKIYITTVVAQVEGDTYFPDFRAERWKITSNEPQKQPPGDQYPTRFEIFEHT
jgi:dihydrofolate reductase